MSPPRRIGILAGGGSLPREIADSIAARGVPVHIVAIDSEADADFGPYPVTRVDWGEIGRMVATLRQTGCSDLVIIGSVTRPDLGSIRPDFGFFRALATVLRLVVAGGDDAVLRGVVRFFETSGFRVVGPARVAPELLLGEGVVAGAPLPTERQRDAEVGMTAIAALSHYDVGQAVVVSDGRVEAFEGAEGTGKLLARVAAQRRQRGLRPEHPLGVLVKCAKATQDARVDLPVIGPATIAQCIEAGIGHIVVEPGRVLAAERAELASRAKAGGVSIVGIASAAAGVAPPRAQAPRARWMRVVDRLTGHRSNRIAQLGKRRVSGRAAGDIDKGSRLVADLQRFTSCRAVVVVRGHVLAVDCGEGPEAVVARAAGLRQWGDRRLKRRAGVLVLAAGRHCTPTVVKAAADAGLAGVAAGLRRFTAGAGPDSVAAADAAGIFIAGYPLEGE